MPGAEPRVALIYAPFGACNHPALGISLLKSALAREGIPCDIHYLNLVLARELGTRICDLIAIQLRSADLVGEWLFAPALLGDNPGADNAYVQQVLWGDGRISLAIRSGSWRTPGLRASSRRARTGPSTIRWPKKDLSDLAFHFDAEYCDASPVYAQGLRQAVRAWQECSGAALDAYPSPGAIRIVDTRSGAARELAFDGRR